MVPQKFKANKSDDEHAPRIGQWARCEGTFRVNGSGGDNESERDDSLSVTQCGSSRASRETGLTSQGPRKIGHCDNV
ncbi:hypothetical protein M413DRAFT_450166 [Hebeloma cylindrosporum]|uniref:Uncharacterized protein n=1 Tax=Hebeloma cylindrosporum TaxID=76867 RepID=A0A0C3BCP7_HEBCY|nr:hypothetical protein M413DRAFT_450166 [Hebeloma cylindrosporum h7]